MNKQDEYRQALSAVIGITMESLKGGSMSKHTPEPWRSPWRIHRILPNNGDFDAAQGERYEVFWRDDGDGVESYTYVATARQHDNARLIAAAPETKRQRDELLAALERTLSNAIGHACDARGDDCNFEDWPWVQQAREAIANATKEEA